MMMCRPVSWCVCWLLMSVVLLVLLRGGKQDVSVFKLRCLLCVSPTHTLAFL